MNYMFMPLKRYFDFSGRSRRKEYWMFVLFVVIGEIITMTLDSVLGTGGSTTTTSEFGDGTASAGIAMSGGIITMIFVLLIIIPGIAVAVRRAHDQDKSGWFILIPIYGFIMMFIEGTRGPNRFGPDPKGADAGAPSYAA
jgi:uncharacterized membrane protein YhaH (DUF805 family)